MNQIDSGFTLLDKQPGMTSFAALNPVKRSVHPRKVGHTGTLDKFAEGLLICAVGKATKLSSYITEMPKEYIAEIEFGKETDTLDPEGALVEESETIPDRDKIIKALDDFTGPQMQIPPLYSAVHVNGERSYKMVRQGKQPVLDARQVFIYEIKLLHYEASIGMFSVKCSKGTYIRSLARDLGISCASRAFVRSLKRTKIGPFTLESAVKPEDFVPDRNIISVEEIIGQIDTIGVLHIDRESTEAVRHGRPLHQRMFIENGEKEGLFAVFSKDERFLALVEKRGGDYVYKFVGI